MTRPPFHDLFRRTDLAANTDYRMRYDDEATPKVYDLENVLRAAEDDCEQRGLTWDQYTGTVPKDYTTGDSPERWYANGAKMPRDRPGLIAVFHPQYHRRGWQGISETITDTAKALQRWVWVCEAAESRWIVAMVGEEPGTDAVWRKYTRPSDQLIIVVNPYGEWKMLGCS